jgi:ABC-type Fe3+/spermidine/putrescine transport system ATPase subunit
MRIELVRLQREVGITSIYVTHDQSEALVMSDRVVVMNNGTIQQIGDPQTIYARPVNAFVANFIGVANLMRGTLTGRSGDVCEVEIQLGDGRAPLHLRALGGAGAAKGQPLTLSVRPEDIAVHLAAPDTSDTENAFQAEVIDTVYLGNFLECRARVGCYELAVQIGHFEHVLLGQLSPGQVIHLSFRPEHGLCLVEERSDTI